MAVRGREEEDEVTIIAATGTITVVDDEVADEEAEDETAEEKVNTPALPPFVVSVEAMVDVDDDSTAAASYHVEVGSVHSSVDVADEVGVHGSDEDDGVGGSCHSVVPCHASSVDVAAGDSVGSGLGVGAGVLFISTGRGSRETNLDKTKQTNTQTVMHAHMHSCRMRCKHGGMHTREATPRNGAQLQVAIPERGARALT